MRKSTDLNMTAGAVFGNRGTRIEPVTDAEKLAARFSRIMAPNVQDETLIDVSRVQRAALMNLAAQMKRKQMGK